ncbi:MAG: PKD domain-containing protein [Chitinophagales bacterium]
MIKKLLVAFSFAFAVESAIGQCQIQVNTTNNPLLAVCSSAIIAQVSGGTPPYSYTWSGNGSNVNDTVFCWQGSGAVTVIVTDANGCVGIDTFSSSPCMNAWVEAIPDSSIHCANGGVPFVASTNLSSGNLQYSWTYNGAVQGTGATHCLPIGITATVVVTNGTCTATTTASSTAYCGNMSANAILDSGTACLIGSAYNIVVTGGIAPYTYSWSNGGAGSNSCAQNGDTVIVTDSWGCKNIVVIGQTPNCNSLHVFVLPDTLSICPQGAPFTAYVNGGTPPYQYQWANGSQTQSICNPAGNLCVTVTDLVGCVTTSCHSNTPACQAYFYWFPDSGSNNNIRFYNASVYNPVAAFWDFGDGDSSYALFPTHVYTTPGTYTVCLVSTDANGCSSTSCQAVTIQTPHSDVAAELYHYSTITPGFPLYTYVAVTNMGSFLEQGTLVYKYPQGVTVTNSAGGVVNTANRTITFSYSGLMPYNAEPFAIGLLADVGLTLGTIAYDSVWVTTTNADSDLSNNLAVVQDSVVGSWDPNDKAVSPKGIGEKGVVPSNTKTFSYLVRFQNTGTAPAQNVRINDMLDNHFDLTTLHVTASSHAHRTSVVNGELIVNFDNIMLPDSNADYAASQGFIAYTIDLKPGVSIGTEMTNTANIYFDFNQPVVTNTTTNKLGFNPNGIEETLNTRVSVVPNPATDRVFIGGIDGRTTNYALFNTLGQQVVSGSLNTNRTISVSSFENGVYSLRLNVEGTTITRQLVIAR